MIEPGALEGLRVLDLTDYRAGLAARLMADMGACAVRNCSAAHNARLLMHERWSRRQSRRRHSRASCSIEVIHRGGLRDAGFP
jgi:crotonobetainyl-CoA:carnitine CoA-transferase CaiB-like acyl-CoA transferase